MLQALYMKHRCQKACIVKEFSLTHVHKSHSPNVGEEGSRVVQIMESTLLPPPAHPSLSIIYVYKMVVIHWSPALSDMPQNEEQLRRIKGDVHNQPPE